MNSYRTVVDQEDYSTSAERTNQTKTWIYYWGNDPSAGVLWQGSPFTQTAITQPRRDLPVGKITANYIPVYSSGQKITYLHSYYQYDSLGKQTAVAQWNGNEWLFTWMEYDTTIPVIS